MKLFFAVLLGLCSSELFAQDRDLSRYEKLEMTVNGDKESAEVQMAQERDFIWNCWTQKRRCASLLKIEFSNQQPNTLQLYVEPDEKGIWQMTYLMNVRLLGKDGKPKRKFFSTQVATRDVTRIEAIKPGEKFNRVEIPDTEIRSAEAFRIWLKLDKSPVKQGFELIFKNGTTTGLMF